MFHACQDVTLPEGEAKGKKALDGNRSCSPPHAQLMLSCPMSDID